MNSELDRSQENHAKEMKNVIISCVLGGAIEWYSFAIYGFFSTIIGRHFFSSTNAVQAAIATLFGFAVGLLSRPLGAVFFSYIGDKFGSKISFSLSIYMMAVSTCLIGVLPSYDQIGEYATVLLMVLRVFQGLALGGGFTGAMVFLYNQAPKEKRNTYTAWSSFCLIAGFLLCAIISTIMSFIFSQDTLQTWGWRLAFIIGIFGVIGANMINKKLQNSKKEVSDKQPTKKEQGLMQELLSHNLKKLFCVILADVLTGCGFFLVAIFFTTYFETFLHIDHKTASALQMINMGIFSCSVLFFGKIADKIGHIKQMKITCIILMLISYPVFILGGSGSLLNASLCQLILMLVFAAYNGVIPTLLCQVFPSRVRLLGVSVSHNVAMAVFGAYTPSLATILIQETGNLAMPGIILILAAAITLVGLYLCSKNIYNSD